MNSRDIGFISLLFLAFLIDTGCSGSAGSSGQNTTATGTTPDFSKLTPACFTTSASNPILTRGSLLSGSDWNDPSVIKVGSQYVMYSSSDNNFDLNIAIYRLVSNDGLNWTLNPPSPVFEADPNPAAWDHSAVETPSVVYFNGQYHLFYTGYPLTYADAYSYKIGHATSADGISWVRDASYIVAPNDPNNPNSNGTFNQWISAEPAAVVFQNKIYLYFTAVGTDAGLGSLEVIGLTTSSDGINWSVPQSVLEPDQALYPRATWIGYSTPMAAVLNGQMHLFFDVAQDTPWKQLRIHHASSADGITGWTHDSSAIFSQSDFTWTSNEIRSPSALLDGTSLFLWFAGDNGATLGIGASKCSL